MRRFVLPEWPPAIANRVVAVIRSDLAEERFHALFLRC
jgi:hypothetical protein